MESHADIDIIVFPEKATCENSDGSVKARTDKSLPFSIISKGMLERLGGVSYTSCQKETVTDSKGVQHSPIGKVALRWHKKESVKSHSETFYVVDSQTALVILGVTSFDNTSQSSGGNMYPIGLQQLTAEQELAMSQNKLQVAQRREQEKKEQEKTEAQRRPQATHKR
ncbi:MAG: hypothetical protein Q9172_005691 [Xanthocarpia lactea]